MRAIDCGKVSVFARAIRMQIMIAASMPTIDVIGLMIHDRSVTETFYKVSFIDIGMADGGAIINSVATDKDNLMLAISIGSEESWPKIGRHIFVIGSAAKIFI